MRAFTAFVDARTWREFGYLLVGAIMAVPAFALALLGIVFSALSLLTVGLPLLVAVLWLAHRTIGYFRAPARVFLGWGWPSPRPVGLRRLIRDPVAWKAIAYCFLTFPVKVTGAYLGAFALVAGAAALTYPAWWFVTRTGWGVMDAYTWGGTWWLAAQGAVALLVFPWFVRLLVAVDRLLAYALLAPSRDQERIAALEAGRAVLRDDAAALLRRVERDLHDGTQARLVALGVALSRIEHRAGDDSLRDLAKDARGTVTDALAELRDIVRGLHPPALDDGLAVALASLAGRSAVPVDVTVELAGRPPDATASAVYFTVAELLTNVAKHAAATRARVDLREDRGRLRLVVSDDGRGGARPDPSGTGLAGLARRAAALDGSLSIDSPAGGPTVVTVTLATGA
jgi:signal transduction histidine kinase